MWLLKTGDPLIEVTTKAGLTVIFMHAQTSPCSELKEKFECMECSGKDKNEQTFLLKIRKIRKTYPSFRSPA